MTIYILLIVAAGAGLISWMLTRHLIGLLDRHKMFDIPSQRSLHEGSIPRGGGLAIVSCLLIALLAVALISHRYAVFGGLATLVFAWSLLGFCDDRYDLSPQKRFAIQILFALAGVAAFGYVTEIQLSQSDFIGLSGVGFLLTVIGILWSANLYNFMDGMDGLAASQTVIAGLTLAFWFWFLGDQFMSIVCLVLAASSYGFLLHNWQPAKIFMGDVGSVTIGAFLAMLTIYGNTRYQIPLISFVLLLAVFVFDASFTIVRRMMNREKFWLPHRSHLYQRLALTDINHSRVVTGAVILMIFCSMIASYTVIDRGRIGAGSVIVVFILISCAGLVGLIESRKSATKKSK